MAGHQGARRIRSNRRSAPIKSALPPEGRQLTFSPEEMSTLLDQGEILSCHVMPAGTNYTFAVAISANGRGQFLAVYKPQSGENPLWDFPRGTLHLREHAAYLTSLQLGWPRVPATVIRDGPYGVGSVQLYIPTQAQWDFNDLRRQHLSELTEIALFDLLVNNADRKAGHCLLGTDGHIWAIDHGLTFHEVPKLRTVLWDYCGEPIPQKLLNDLEFLRDDPSSRERLWPQLERDLAPTEIEAFSQRLEIILRAKEFPHLDPRLNIPWPLI